MAKIHWVLHVARMCNTLHYSPQKIICLIQVHVKNRHQTCVCVLSSNNSFFTCVYVYYPPIIRFSLACDIASVLLPSVLWRCWLGGRKGIWPVNNFSGGMQAWLSVWSEAQTCIQPSWCHCHSLSLASVKSRLVLPLWYQLTWVVLEKSR